MKSIAILIVLLLIVGCQQPNGTITASKELSAETQHSEAQKLTPERLFAALGLQKGAITASDAAKKIAEQKNKTIAGFHFEQAEAKAYNDEEGTFTVQVKGYTDGTPKQIFDETFTAEGFTHPYKNTILSSIVLQTGSKLVFDKAIENNTSLTAFIAEANAAQGIGYTAFSYTLAQSEKTVTIGDHSEYELKAVLTENTSPQHTIKVQAKYAIKYKKYTGSGSEIIMFDDASTKTVLEKESYFKQNDVFAHILREVKKEEGFIKTGNKFASEFYARAVTANKTPDGLFDTAKLQKYRDVYSSAAEGNQLTLLDIDVAVLEPRNTVKADDYAGTLTLTYCIATKNLIQSNDFVPAAETIETTTKTGFRKISETTAKNLFSFGLTKQQDGSLEGWKKTAINKILVREQEAFSANNWITISQENQTLSKYVLSLNGISDFAFNAVLADKNNAFLSKGTSDELILIKNITLSKPANNNTLSISITFEGTHDGVDGKPIVLTAAPSY